MAPRPQIKTQLLQFFTEREGRTVFMDELRRVLNLEDSQIRNGINNLRSGTTVGGIDFQASIQVITQGNAWVYNTVMASPATPSVETPALRSFREVGTLKDGSVMIQCDKGQIFKAVAM